MRYAIDPDDQAFPLTFPDQDYFEGLTKREYLAAIAFQITLNRPGSLEDRARQAVLAADALINALNEECEPEGDSNA